MTGFFGRHPHLNPKLKPEKYSKARLYAKAEPAILQHFTEVGKGQRLAAEYSGQTVLPAG